MAATCSQVQSYPLSMLEALTANCVQQRSACAGATECGFCNDGNGGGTMAQASCRDGCTSSTAAFRPIYRHTVGALTAVGSVGGGSPFYATTVGFRHFFDPPADGSVEYYYEPNAANLRAPKLNSAGKGGTAVFDGTSCATYQVWCNEEQTVYANTIDCRAVDGGALIDLCQPPPAITPESSKMEILFWVPQILCDDPSLLPNDPVVGSGSSSSSTTTSTEGELPINDPMVDGGSSTTAPTSTEGELPIGMPTAGDGSTASASNSTTSSGGELPIGMPTAGDGSTASVSSSGAARETWFRASSFVPVLGTAAVAAGLAWIWS